MNINEQVQTVIPKVSTLAKKYSLSDEELSADYIIPKAFDPRVGKAVAEAVAEGASAMTPSTLDWIGLALICIVLPAVLSLLFDAFLRKIGWVKTGDMKLTV